MSGLWPSDFNDFKKRVKKFFFPRYLPIEEMKKPIPKEDILPLALIFCFCILVIGLIVYFAL